MLDALLDEGYRPDVDEDGDVSVRVQGQQLFVRCMDTVPPLMRVFGQWMIGEDVPGDELLRLQAANAVTGTLNLVKATVFDDRLVIAVDLVVADSLDLRALAHGHAGRRPGLGADVALDGPGARGGPAAVDVTQASLPPGARPRRRLATLRGRTAH